MDYVAAFNLVEAAWWFAVATIIGSGRISTLNECSRTRQVLVGIFVTFGVSDLIEMKTGAWWRPAGLLVMKAMCILTFIACTVSIVLRERRRK